MKKTFLLIGIIGLLGSFYSCSKSAFDIKPKGEANVDLFKNKAGVEKLLIGTYACVDGAVNSNVGLAWASSVSNWVWGSIASDDAYKGASVGDQSGINPVEYYNSDASNSYVANHWSTYYEAMLRANDVLKIIPQATDMTDTEKKTATAQARFLRAHFYFELTTVHGKVPYIDETTVDPAVVPNSHTVWPEMEADMKYAVENLPNSWTDKGRVTKWAAKTYLGRIYLFQQKFAEAMPLFRDVYTNGGFRLMPSYEQNFGIAYNNNAESIWEIEYAVNDGATGSPNAGWGDGLAFPHGTAGLGIQGAFYQASHNFVSAFRVGADGLPLLDDTYSADDILPYSKTGTSVPYTKPVDPRLDWTVGRPGIPYLDWGIHAGDSWVVDYLNYGPYNYKKNMFLKSEKSFATSTGWMNGVNANNYRKFKLGHVVLWLAECEAEVGTLHNATTLVNEIRNRARKSNVVKFDNGTPAANYLVQPYAADFATKEYARKAIRMEHRLEFGMEGNRFFDLVRWGIASDVLNAYLAVEGTIMPPLTNRNFTKGKNEVWPIPQLQTDLSGKTAGKSVLIQNAGF